MPTIIDSLIVTLGLNPTNFTQGQKAAVASLQQLQQQAATTSTGVQRSGAGIVSFFNAAQHPVNALHQAFARLAVSTATTAPLQTNLNRMAAQGRVAGAGIQAGALAGASGLRVLGIAGLAAFTAYTALNKVISEAKENAGNIFRTGLGAAGAGMGVRGFSAISQALNVVGNVPEEDTQKWLAEYRQWRLRLQTSQGDPSRLTPLAETQAGLRPYTDTGEEVLIKLARKLQGLSDDKAIQAGGLASLTAAQSIALKKAGRDLPALTANEIERATTEKQLNEAEKTLQGMNNLTIALNDLKRIIWTDLNPAVQKIADILGAVVKFLKFTHDQPLTSLEKSALVTGPVPAAAVVGRRVWDYWFGKNKSKDAPSAPAASAPGPGATGGGNTDLQDKLTKGFISGGLDPREAAAMAARLAVINKYEAAEGDIENKKGESTASGYWQFTDPTWKDTVGADYASRQRRAIGAPMIVQGTAAAKLWNQRGYQPWTAMTPERIAEAEAAANAARAGAGIGVKPLSGMARGMATGTGNDWLRRNAPFPTIGPGGRDVARVGVPAGGVYSGRGGGDGPLPAGWTHGIDSDEVRRADPNSYGPFSPYGRVMPIDLIRRANAGSTSNSSTTNSSSVNTGDINVQTQATDGYGTGSAVANAIKRIVESNSGLSG